MGEGGSFASYVAHGLLCQPETQSLPRGEGFTNPMAFFAIWVDGATIFDGFINSRKAPAIKRQPQRGMAPP